MTQQLPDARKHQLISFAKSFIRVLAGGTLCANLIVTAGILLIVAEVLGIAEELV